jgi:hypothetical protein
VIHELELASLENKNFRVPDDDKAFTEDNHDLNEDKVLFKEFTALDFNNFELNHEYHNTNINFNDSWILL